MIRNIHKRVRRRLEISAEADLVAPEQNANDLYLVEYPKSGITWLSVLLANTLLINEGSEHRATFSSVRSYIPDLHVTKFARAPEFVSPRVRLYKSHAKFHPAYVNIVYLVRHPVAVMRSHYRFRSSLGHYQGNFDDFCFGSGYGVEGWKRHVASWLLYPHNTNQRFIHLIRYEDLLADTVNETEALARNFGWSLAPGTAAMAKAASGREAMLAQEAFYRSRNPAHRMEFVSAGVSEAMAPDTAKRISELCAPELDMLGYAADTRRQL